MYIKEIVAKMKRKRKTTKYIAYLLFGAGNIKKIAEALTLEEIRKRARTKRKEFSRRTGEWVQIMIYRGDKFYEML